MKNYKEMDTSCNPCEDNCFYNRISNFVGEFFKLIAKNKIVIVIKDKKFYVTTAHDNGAKYIVINKGKENDNISRANISIEFPCPLHTIDFYSKLMKIFGTYGVWLEYVEDNENPYIYINVIKDYKNENYFESIYYEDIDEVKFEYKRVITIKTPTGSDFEFANIICNTENL